MNITLVNGPASLSASDVEDCETVADLIELFREQLNIPSNATASVNGSAATLETPIQDGDEVAFNKPTGSKG